MYQIIELNYSHSDFNEPSYEQDVPTEAEALYIASAKLSAMSYGRVYIVHNGQIISDAEII